jgi:hypothetical protein
MCIAIFRNDENVAAKRGCAARIAVRSEYCGAATDVANA